MIKMRYIRGITLIALVITIIILLILAGITITSLTNSGLFEKARQASEKYKEEQEKENEILKEYEEWLANSENLPENTEDTEAGTPVKIPEEWYTQSPDIVETTKGEIVKKGSKTANVYAVSDGQANTIPVPYGFFYVGGTIASGVVISDNSADKNKYAGQTDVPEGVEYNLETGIPKADNELSEEEKKKVIFGNQFVWIPCTEENYTKVDFGIKNSTAYDTSTNSAEKTQIQKYKGFYVGRYEAGTSNIKLKNDKTWLTPSGTSNWLNESYTSNNVESGNITTKAGEIPYFHANYTTAVEMSEKMYKTNSVNSGLMTGTMWDVVMKFITTDNTSYSDLKNTPWGNYNKDTSSVSGSNITYTEGRGRYLSVDSSNGIESGTFTKSDTIFHTGIRTTGWSEGAKKNNIYDLAGNLWEWTQEMSFLNNNTNLLYNIRGGSFDGDYTSTYYPICCRIHSNTSYAYTNRGFRPALYIK